MDSAAEALARWAHELVPDAEDLGLAQRSLVDTLAVTLAARDDDLVRISAGLPDAARWAAVGHVLDFDDLHMESTAHISVVCVPATLAAGGDARAYLAGAGVMARIGMALGWSHYASGWHATCTAGAPAAAVCAAVALGLSREQIATAMALAVPAAGGVQRAFGSSGKSLQVGFAADAGVRAARLAAAGATADPTAVDAWLRLVGGDPERIDVTGPAVPGGLAIKMFPCCYALQRPISALREQLPAPITPAEVTGIEVRTPACAVQPLIHHRPNTGLQGKFSMEYAVATVLLDPHPGFGSFTDRAVNRPEAQRLLKLVKVTETPGGDWLLAGQVAITATLADGTRHDVALQLPPGSPGRPPSEQDMTAKIADCGEDVPALLSDVDWHRAVKLLAEHLPGEVVHDQEKEPA
ncbi:2-methylcitrate dehydratase [Saccharopolyspora karakumensis]|uniref:2-methylcitrate dehydratase n=1 Tax=Saccharopolyspora karakumensis TaxID=2530386 RepID=A0A4R5BFN4_9PSEU|nr:MmgE/PrpD family protein [Saccharopolyspora karakumensis]TDD85171.1 2-methylcitrate dehydratase [Saccharopolyspora karakumensis]